MLLYDIKNITFFQDTYMLARIILNTAPNLEVAKTIAQSLVEKRLAACVNIIPAATSIYRWEGQILEEQELLLIIKTSSQICSEALAHIKKSHPYDTPELVVLCPAEVDPKYHQWLLDSVA